MLRSCSGYEAFYHQMCARQICLLTEMSRKARGRLFHVWKLVMYCHNIRRGIRPTKLKKAEQRLKQKWGKIFCE